MYEFERIFEPESMSSEHGFGEEVFSEELSSCSSEHVSWPSDSPKDIKSLNLDVASTNFGFSLFEDSQQPTTWDELMLELQSPHTATSTVETPSTPTSFDSSITSSTKDPERLSSEERKTNQRLSPVAPFVMPSNLHQLVQGSAISALNSPSSSSTSPSPSSRGSDVASVCGPKVVAALNRVYHGALDLDRLKISPLRGRKDDFAFDINQLENKDEIISTFLDDLNRGEMKNLSSDALAMAHNATLVAPFLDNGTTIPAELDFTKLGVHARVRRREMTPTNQNFQTIRTRTSSLVTVYFLGDISQVQAVLKRKPAIYGEMDAFQEASEQLVLEETDLLNFCLTLRDVEPQAMLWPSHSNTRAAAVSRAYRMPYTRCFIASFEFVVTAVDTTIRNLRGKHDLFIDVDILTRVQGQNKMQAASAETTVKVDIQLGISGRGGADTFANSISSLTEESSVGDNTGLATSRSEGSAVQTERFSFFRSDSDSMLNMGGAYLEINAPRIRKQSFDVALDSRAPLEEENIFDSLPSPLRRMQQLELSPKENRKRQVSRSRELFVSNDTIERSKTSKMELADDFRSTEELAEPMPTYTNAMPMVYPLEVQLPHSVHMSASGAFPQTPVLQAPYMNYEPSHYAVYDPNHGHYQKHFEPQAASSDSNTLHFQAPYAPQAATSHHVLYQQDNMQSNGQSFGFQDGDAEE